MNVAESDRENQARGKPPQSERNEIAVAKQVLSTQLAIGIARYFEFNHYRTNFRTEILAGITTFMTMTYVLVVNPLILSDSIFINQPKNLFAELVIATAVSAGVSTLIMGLLTKYSFALAPGMGINVFFAYSVVLGWGIDWRVALACVFEKGLAFILLTITDIRRHLITAVPSSIKSATTVGIGLFLASIGYRSHTSLFNYLFYSLCLFHRRRIIYRLDCLSFIKNFQGQS